jgi:DNA polymerase-1
VPADLFYDYKAMVGDRGDNVPGVDGIGKKRAAELLDRYGTLEEIIAAGSGSACKHSRRVFDSAEAARLSRQLVQLRTDVPIPPIPPASCAVHLEEPAYA